MSGKEKIVVFISRTCPNCPPTLKALREVVENKYRDRLEIEVLDIREHFKEAIEHGVYAVPMIILRDSKLIGRKNKEEIELFIESVLGS